MRYLKARFIPTACGQGAPSVYLASYRSRVPRGKWGGGEREGRCLHSGFSLNYPPRHLFSGHPVSLGCLVRPPVHRCPTYRVSRKREREHLQAIESLMTSGWLEFVCGIPRPEA